MKVTGSSIDSRQCQVLYGFGSILRSSPAGCTTHIHGPALPAELPRCRHRRVDSRTQLRACRRAWEPDQNAQAADVRASQPRPAPRAGHPPRIMKRGSSFTESVTDPFSPRPRTSMGYTSRTQPTNRCPPAQSCYPRSLKMANCAIHGDRRRRVDDCRGDRCRAQRPNHPHLPGLFLRLRLLSSC